MIDSFRCERCGKLPTYPKPKDVKSFLCSKCSMGAVRIISLQEEEKYGQVAPEAVKSARKECPPFLTQKDLDAQLGLPTNHTNRVENGHEIPCKRLFNFVRAFQSGKITKVPYQKRSKTVKKRRKKKQ